MWRKAGAGREERTVEVDREHLLPFRVAELFDRVDDLDAGVADENVDAAEVTDRGVHAVAHLSLIADVHRHAHGHAALGRRSPWPSRPRPPSSGPR